RCARLTEPARMLADELAATAPELYRAKTITAVHDVPHQLVRFRGTTPEATRLEVYGAAPLDSLDVEPGDSLQTGFFLFDAAYVPVWDARRLALIGGRAVDYLRIELPPLDPGEYAIHIEVTDAASGERAESVRLIRVARASDSPSRPE